MFAILKLCAIYYFSYEILSNFIIIILAILIGILLYASLYTYKMFVNMLATQTLMYIQHYIRAVLHVPFFILMVKGLKLDGEGAHRYVGVNETK